jgi:hypothetical protein
MMLQRRLRVSAVNLGRVSLDPVAVESTADDYRDKALLFNIGELSRAAQQMQVSTISFINFAGLITVGALTLGLVRSEPLIILLAPYGLIIVLGYLLQLYTDIERMTTLREVFEKHANLRLGAPAFLGFNPLSRRYRGRLSVRLLGILNAAPLVLLGYFSLTEASRHAAPSWSPLSFVVLHGLALSLCAVVPIRAGWEMLRAREGAVREAEAVLGPTP